MVDSVSSAGTFPGEHPAPRLLAAGIDVGSFDPPRLSRALWRLIEDLVLAVRGAEDRWELACALPQRCGQRLAAGESAADLQAWLRHPAVVRLLKDRREVRMAVIDSSLPLPLLERLAAVRRRLARWWPGRLRRAERERVLVESCETWADALTSGTPVATLLQEPLKSQVRNSRNEQLRRRGWLSRVVRQCRQGVLWGLLAGGLVYAGLWIRLALLQPSAAGLDPLEAFDQATRAIPQEQRAWPLVKQFWQTEPWRGDTRWQLGLSSAWAAGPSDPNWAEACAKLESIGDSWDLLLQASRKPTLGYLFRDWPDQQVQLSSVMLATSFSRWQSRQLSIALHLLQGEAHRALENRDPDRAVEMALAALRLARLACDAGNHPSLRQLGDNGVLEVVALMGTICQSGQLPADALVRLRDAIVEPRAERTPPEVDVEQVLIQQLDRMYSPGENGAVTWQGLQMLWSESVLPGGMTPVLGWMMWPADRPWFQPWLLRSGESVQPLGPVLAPLMMGRRGARDEIVRMVAAASERAGPQADAQTLLTELRVELAEVVQTSWSQCRYAPVIATLQSSLPLLADLLAVPLDPRRSRAAEGALAIRLGLELHRQRTGQFAASLSDLVPQDLAEWPVDPYDGQPLKVRQIGDRRWLYSVGEDGQDNTRGWDQENAGKPVHPKDLRLGEVEASSGAVPAAP